MKNIEIGSFPVTLEGSCDEPCLITGKSYEIEKLPTNKLEQSIGIVEGFTYNLHSKKTFIPAKNPREASEHAMNTFFGKNGLEILCDKCKANFHVYGVAAGSID